jgi:hypothetical protein
MRKFNLAALAVVVMAIAGQSAYGQGQSSGVNTQQPQQQTRAQATGSKTNSASIKMAPNAGGSGAKASSGVPQGGVSTPPSASGSGQSAQTGQQKSGGQPSTVNESKAQATAPSPGGSQAVGAQNRIYSNDDFKSDTSATGRINEGSGPNAKESKSENQPETARRSQDSGNSPEK